jgi:hypothetical protein
MAEGSAAFQEISNDIDHLISAPPLVQKYSLMSHFQRVKKFHLLPGRRTGTSVASLPNSKPSSTAATTSPLTPNATNTSGKARLSRRQVSIISCLETRCILILIYLSLTE